MKDKLKMIENELISVYETDKGEKVVYGTELFECLGSKRQYTDWIKERFLDCDAIENQDFQSFSQKNEKGGRPKTEYIIKLDIAKEMAMLERNDIGKKVRRYFISVEERYKEIASQRSHWQQTRIEAKNTRRMETDEIKQLVEYAKKQGSEHAERYYTLFSKLANKAVGIGKDQREQLSVRQLNNLTLVEQIIGEVIRQGMAADLYYKEIYKACSDRLGQFTSIVYLA